MKITALKTFVMDAYRTNWTFLKVETDEGLHGWGEASLGTQEMALSGCVEDLKRLVVGRDPREEYRLSDGGSAPTDATAPKEQIPPASADHLPSRQPQSLSGRSGIVRNGWFGRNFQVRASCREVPNPACCAGFGHKKHGAMGNDIFQWEKQCFLRWRSGKILFRSRISASLCMDPDVFHFIFPFY